MGRLLFTEQSFLYSISNTDLKICHLSKILFNNIFINVFNLHIINFY